LLADPARTTGVIADGIHLHPATVAVAWQAKGATRLNLVTDAMAALGMPPGQYRLGDWDVIVDGRSARLADGRLAGSVLSLDEAVRNLIAFTGCPLEAGLATVTTVPAAVLGQQGRRGQVAPGYAADLVLLTADFQVQSTIVAGEVVYTAAEAPVATAAGA
jgi:N-acetylglucosamine-6-phosphate deacetylase